jgi:hypothetical protein
MQVRHKRVPSRNWLSTDIKTVGDYRKGFVKLCGWYGGGLRGGAIDLRIWMVRDEPLPRRIISNRAATLPTAPQSTTPPAITPRQTETERQMEQREDEIDALDRRSSGNHTRRIGIELRSKWTCGAAGCANKGSHCYWQGTDTADNHLPLNDEIVKGWARKIDKKRATYEEPPSDL